MADHAYSLSSVTVEGKDAEEIEVDELILKEKSMNPDHTPMKAPNPKKKKRSAEDTMESRLKVVCERTEKMDRQNEKLDAQTELLRKLEGKIKSNTEAIMTNKLGIDELQKKMEELQVENKRLNEEILDQARYKRRWNLRLNGLPEKDGENSREVVIGILTRVIPVSVEKLQDAVDTVHRLGTKGTTATPNNRPPSIIIQFALRTIKDEVWKRCGEAPVCEQMHIHFKKDFIKQDREARPSFIHWYRKQGGRIRKLT